jgi:hypothetical protein
LDVTLTRFEKNSIPASPVISMSPNLDRVPYRPPNEKGSRGTGMPAQGREDERETLGGRRARSPLAAERFW